MAATAAAAVGSSFSINTLKCIRGKNYLPPSDALLRISSTTRMSHVASLSHSLPFESFSIGDHISYKWRVPKIIAAVAQEEAAAVESGEAEGEAVEDVEGGGDETESAVNTKLYFGNLPYNFDSAMLAGIIQDYGSPELVEVLYDRETGRSRGFAFVTMSTIEDCNAVIENLDGSEFGGRTLRVNFADKPKPREPLYPETDHKLFVGNLSWSVTSESLTQAFQEYGNVVGARVLYDGETGQSRGYGFVCYSTRAELETALESLNGVVCITLSLSLSLSHVY
ncbi:RNA recognition motif domain [Dillenia turbinata]|uniref:RNA recognition motif domain n=1 Tax=Dillenia turbinata TaxID=194707 RepID=A0AAN8VHX3_9MAGN